MKKGKMCMHTNRVCTPVCTVCNVHKKQKCRVFGLVFVDNSVDNVYNRVYMQMFIQKPTPFGGRMKRRTALLRRARIGAVDRQMDM